jgi:hypothetical protein
LPLDAETWTALVESLRGNGLRFDEVALYTRTQRSRGSFALLAIDGGESAAFVRVGSPESIDKECHALALLETSRLQAFDFPRLLARGSIGPMGYAAFTVALDGLHRPAKYQSVEGILAEVRESLRRLPHPPGMPAHWEPMHGDFTPWNVREVSGGGGPVLVDWESAAWGPPGADGVMHYAASRALGLQTSHQPQSPEAARFWIERLEPATNKRDARLGAGLMRHLARVGGE